MLHDYLPSLMVSFVKNRAPNLVLLRVSLLSAQSKCIIERTSSRITIMNVFRLTFSQVSRSDSHLSKSKRLKLYFEEFVMSGTLTFDFLVANGFFMTQTIATIHRVNRGEIGQAKTVVLFWGCGSLTNKPRAANQPARTYCCGI